MTPLLINIIFFSCFCLVGSLFMCGLYKATRKGMILGWWSEYWEATRKDVVGYESDLEEQRRLKQLAVEAGDRESIVNIGSKLHSIEDCIKLLKNSGLWYKRPAWLVHPIAGCVYCFASVYGSLFFWIAGYALIGATAIKFSFSSSLIILWILFMFCTCALNGIIIKKVL